MHDDNPKRLSRLTAILTQLQTQRLITATTLAEKFGVSIRTIYRDVRALEESGVPIVTEEGKGYSIMEGYRLPPVSFTENEANAMITAHKLVLGNKDSSLIREHTSAIEKIKAVLRMTAKDNAELLDTRMAVTFNNRSDTGTEYLSLLQTALTNYQLTRISYQKDGSDDTSDRIVEPFALLSTQGNWILVAWCRLRKEFRLFRLDRIRALEITKENFDPHKMTLQEYFERSQ
jgi:predicted DNA-binding transcriptional regulator YafY